MTRLTLDELEVRIATVKNDIIPGTIWKHYKGSEYTVQDIVVREEDTSLAVVYSSVEHPAVSFTRPVSEWNDRVEWDGTLVDRFSNVI